MPNPRAPHVPRPRFDTWDLHTGNTNTDDRIHRVIRYVRYHASSNSEISAALSAFYEHRHRHVPCQLLESLDLPKDIRRLIDDIRDQIELNKTFTHKVRELPDLHTAVDELKNWTLGGSVEINTYSVDAVLRHTTDITQALMLLEHPVFADVVMDMHVMQTCLMKAKNAQDVRAVLRCERFSSVVITQKMLFVLLFDKTYRARQAWMIFLHPRLQHIQPRGKIVRELLSRILRDKDAGVFSSFIPFLYARYNGQPPDGIISLVHQVCQKSIYEQLHGLTPDDICMLEKLVSAPKVEGMDEETLRSRWSEFI